MRAHSILRWLLSAALGCALPSAVTAQASGQEGARPGAAPPARETPNAANVPEAGIHAEGALDPAYLPMPADRADRLAAAIEAAMKRLEPGSLPHCWLSALGDAKVDDRLLEWTRICPPFSQEGLLAGPHCSLTALPQDLLFDQLRDARAVDEADESLHFAVHLRSLVLAIGGRADVEESLASMEEDVKAAEGELAKVKAESRSRHYLALREWLAARKADARSLYQKCSR